MLSQAKVGTHSPFGERSHTRAHTAKQGGLPSLVHSAALCCLRNPFYSTVLLYTYISRFSVAPTISNSSISDHLSSRFSTSFTNGPRLLSRAKAGYTLGFRRKIAHNGSHGETGGVSDGVLLLPSDCFTRFGNPAWPGGRAANFAVFGSWPGALPKNAESLRNSDALMRVAVPRRRGPAGLRDPVSALWIMW